MFLEAPSFPFNGEGLETDIRDSLKIITKKYVPKGELLMINTTLSYCKYKVILLDQVYSSNFLLCKLPKKVTCTFALNKSCVKKSLKV